MRQTSRRVFEPVKDEASQKEFQGSERRGGKSRKGFRYVARRAGKDGERQILRLAPTSSSRCSSRPRASTSISPSSKRSHVRISSAISRRSRQNAKNTRPARPLIECNAKANAVQGRRRGPGRRGDEAARRSAKIYRRKRTSFPFRAPRNARSAKAPPYKAWNFAYINIPGPVRDGICRRFITSRRPIRRGRKRKQEAYIPGRGQLAVHIGARRLSRATFCNSCTPTARNRNSVRSLSATRLPKAGRITPRR